MFKFSKKVFFVLVAFLASCSSSEKDENVLILGTNAEYPPYEFIDGTGRVAGFDIDIAEKIAANLGKKLVVKQMGFDALILSLKNKKIDFLMAGMSITQERKKEIAMIPYNGAGIEEMELLFWEKIPPGIQSIRDLKGQVITAQSATIQEMILNQYEEVQHKSLDSIMEMVMDLKYGKSAAILVEPRISHVLKLKFSEIASLPLPLSAETVVLGDGIGVHKENSGLIAEIEKSLSAMKENGELKSLHQKWFQTEE